MRILFLYLYACEFLHFSDFIVLFSSATSSISFHEEEQVEDRLIDCINTFHSSESWTYEWCDGIHLRQAEYGPFSN